MYRERENMIFIFSTENFQIHFTQALQKYVFLPKTAVKKMLKPQKISMKIYLTLSVDLNQRSIKYRLFPVIVLPAWDLLKAGMLAASRKTTKSWHL